MATVEKAAFVKNDGKYIHPETCANVVYYDEEHTVTVKEKIDEILEKMEGMSYIQIAIESFTVTHNKLERGGIITSITFNAKFNKTPASIAITIGGVIYDNISIEPGSTDFEYTIDKIIIKEETTCKLNITDSKGGSTSKSITIYKNDRYYYGALTEFNQISDLDHIISTSRKMDLTVTANENEFIYFCYPITDINDLASFKVGGFDGGFTPIGLVHINISRNNSEENITVISDKGIKNISEYNIINNTTTTTNNTTKTKISYIIYKSDNSNLGTTTFSIS